MLLNTIRMALSLAGLVPAAASDLAVREIPDAANIPLLAAAVIRLVWQSDREDRLTTILFTVLLAVLFCVITVKDYSSMGGGDMKLLLSLSLAFGMTGSCVGMLFSCAAALICGKVKKTGRLAMAPFFLGGFTAAGALQFLGAIR